MKKLLLLLSIMVLSTVASAQYTYQIVLRNATAADSGTSANIIGSGAAFHNLTWNVSGTVSTCSVRVDGSADGITWGTGDVIGVTTCTSNGNTLSASHIVNYVRINLVTFTGTLPVFTANVSGYITQPSGGGTVTSVTCGTGLSGGTITSTGTCSIPNSGVTAASYTSANITVDARGFVTAASNGSAASSGLVLICEQTAATAAELDFKSANCSGTNVFTSTYDDYTMTLVGITVSSNAANLNFQFSTDNGSTYAATTYNWSDLYSEQDTASNGRDNGASQTSLTLNGGVTLLNTATPAIAGTYRIHDPLNASNFKFMDGMSSAMFSTNSGVYMLTWSGSWRTVTAANAFRVIPSAGTFSGTVRVYGLSK